MAAEQSLDPRVSAVTAFNEGVIAAQKGDLEKAAEHWRHAIEQDRMLVPAARNLGIWFEEKQDYTRAAECYAMVLDADPYHTEALIRRAFTLTRLDRLDDAVTAYEQAIAVYPWFRFWYEEVANLLDNAGRRDEAGQWRERATKLDADEAEMAFEDGIRNLREDNLPLAVACFEAITEEYPGNTEARVRLAIALERLGHMDDAIAQLGAALEASADNTPSVLYRRAIFHMRNGNNAAAREDLDLALTHEPGFGRARRLLDDLDGISGTEAPAAQPGGNPSTSIPTSAGAAGAGESWPTVIGRLIGQLTPESGVALLYQPARSMAPVANQLIPLLSDPSLGLVQGKRLFAAEAELIPRPGQGVRQSGFLGTPELASVDTSEWGTGPALTQLEPLLGAALAAFSGNCKLVIILSSGRLRADGPAVAELVRSAADTHFVLLHPAGNPSEVTRRMGPVAAQWHDIPVDTGAPA